MIERLDLEQKEKIFWSVYHNVICLELEKGHLNWNYSQLARASNVNRTSLYFYFGKDKKDLLRAAIVHFCDQIAGGIEENQTYWKQGEIAKALMRTRFVLQTYSEIIPYYYYYKNKDNEWGELLREFDRNVLELRMNFFPHLTKDEILFLRALQMGLVLSPELTMKALEKGLEQLKGLWEKKRDP